MKSTLPLVIIGAIVLILLGLGVSWLTVDNNAPRTDVPWNIESTADGSVRVFHTHLGVTTLGEFVQRYHEAPEVSLFVQAGDKRVIEAYFDQIVMGDLKSKMVLALDVDVQTLNDMYSHGARISTLPGGVRKVELGSEDLARLPSFSIVSMTYIPSINVDAGLVEKRFGQPAQKIPDPNSGAVHWLYPDKGLDIALNDAGKEVFQYVQPKDFNRIVEPLQQAGPK
jgi:hypothetical protein